MKSCRSKTTPAERAALVRELRRRYLQGTLEEVLIPADPPLERLIEELTRRTPRPV